MAPELAVRAHSNIVAKNGVSAEGVNYRVVSNPTVMADCCSYAMDNAPVVDRGVVANGQFFDIDVDVPGDKTTIPNFNSFTVGTEDDVSPYDCTIAYVYGAATVCNMEWRLAWHKQEYCES